MTYDAAILCSFSSGLDDLSKEDQRDDYKVCRVLAEAGKFSIFEVTEDIGETLGRLHDRGWFVYGGGEYPWTEVDITSKGRKALGLVGGASE